MRGIHARSRWGLSRDSHTRGTPTSPVAGGGAPLRPARSFARIFPEGLEAGVGGWGCDPSCSLLVNTKPPSRHAGVRGLSAWLPEHLTGAESGEGMEIPG